jgi:hypothetical protein
MGERERNAQRRLHDLQEQVKIAGGSDELLARLTRLEAKLDLPEFEEPLRPGPDDIGLFSYPRSGNTWMRTVLSQLIHGRSGRSQADLDFFAPDLHTGPKVSKVISAPVHVFKSHDPLGPSAPTGTWDFRRIIYLVRDPRDVVLSYFRYRTRGRPTDLVFSDYVQEFVSGSLWPGSWSSHVSSYTNPGTEGPERTIAVVRYEDLIDEPMTHLSSALEHVQVEHTASTLAVAIEAGRADTMRAREASGMRQSEDNEGRPYFVGAAEYGGWKGKLDPTDIEAIQANFGYQMRRFGYWS